MLSGNRMLRRMLRNYRKEKDAEETCMMRSLINFTFHQILLG
jgi:hypothetical protein